LNFRGQESGWTFRSSPKIAPGVSRSVSLDQTESRARQILPRLPATRLSDLTPLDPIRLPVFTVVTPLARDLTIHMGKGTDAAGARVSALLEAVERVSAETAPPGSTVRARFTELLDDPRRPPVDPVTLDLPDDTAYSPEREITWIESFDLLAGSPVLLPADLALNPPSEGVLRDVDTNGLASGNTRLEAVVHGLCEVIERDVISQREFVAQFGDPGDPKPADRKIDLSTLPAPIRSWVERVLAHRLDISVQDVAGDLGVPTFCAILSDYAYPTLSGLGAVHFPGWGTAPDAQTAILRAITEAVQSRVGAIQAARDAFNLYPFGTRAATRGDRIRQMQPGGLVPFSRAPSFESMDLLADLEWLLDRLASAGLRQVLVTDLTRPDFGIPVVRVRVPGLSFFFGNRRRIGWRCLRHLL
jgi:ribosomal protein S12 methylthiotransferase accessory factor